MNVSDAAIEYIKSEIIPHISGSSEMTAAILNGALRAGRKRFAQRIADVDIIRLIGIVDANGCADREVIRAFADGMFEGREKVSVSLAEIVKVLTGVDSSSELLRDKLTFSRADADKFLALLEK